MIFQILALLLVVVVIVAYIDIKYAISIAMAIMLLIPSSIKFNLSAINLNVFNLLVFIILLFSIKLIIKGKRKREANLYMPSIKKPLVLKRVFIWYLVYTIITSFLASFMDIPFGEYIKNILLFSLEFIILGYCFIFIPIDSKAIKLFDVVLFLCSIVIVVYGIINYIVGTNIYMAYIALVADMDIDMSNAFQEETRGVISGRISSTFTHPLQLGQVALLIFSYAFFQYKDKLNKVVYILLMFGLFMMCVLSGSRSAVFPVVLIFVIIAYFKGIKNQLKYILLVMLTIVFIYPFLPKTYRTTIEGMVLIWDKKAEAKADIHGSSVDGRTTQLEDAFSAINGRELFGYGTGHVTKYGDTHPGLYGYESIVLRYLVDGGILGLIAFLFFYLKLYRFLVNQCRTKEERARAHSLCLPFLMSSFLTGISYAFFGLFIFFYFMTYYNLQIISFKRLSSN